MNNNKTHNNSFGSIGLGVSAMALSIAAAAAFIYFDEQNQTTAYPHAQAEGQAQGEVLQKFTINQVAQHNKLDDAWLIIDGLVYDFSNFILQHPGGHHIISKFAGKDVSKQYKELSHSAIADQIRSGLIIGQIDQEEYKLFIENKMKEEKAEREKFLSSEGQGEGLGRQRKNEKKTIVILGAGIVGVVAAYFISLCDWIINDYSVLVIDKNSLEGGTALKSSAICFRGKLLEHRKANIEADLFTTWTGDVSLGLMEKVEKEWGVDIGLKQKNLIGIYSTPQEEKFAIESNKKDPKTILTREELLSMEPAFQGNEQLRGGIMRESFSMDPYAVCNFFAEKAKANGVKFLYNYQVDDIKRNYDVQTESDIFDLVSNDGKTISANYLLLCCGAHDRDLAKKLGHSVKVRPVHGQMLSIYITDPKLYLNNMYYSYEGVIAGKVADNCTVINKSNNENLLTDQDDNENLSRVARHFYTSSLLGSPGMFRMGGDRISGFRNDRVYKQGLDVTLNHTLEIFPALKNNFYTVGGGWGGTMPFTVDQNLIVGNLEEKLLVSTGSPFTKGPAAGLLTATALVKTLLKNRPLPIKEEEELKSLSIFQQISGASVNEITKQLYKARPQR